MKLRSTIQIAFVACAGISVAQINVAHIERTDNISSGTFASLHDNSSWDLAGGAGSFKLDGYGSAGLDTDETNASAHHNLYISIHIDPLPVLLTNIQFSSDGKFVFVGALPGDRLAWAHEVYLSEFDDVNGNNIWDVGESSVQLRHMRHGFNDEFGEGIYPYNVGPSPWPDLLLGPGVNYVARIHTFWIASYEEGVPTRSVTNEFHGPTFGGHELTFNHEVVPEPATMAVLGLGAAALIRRRKK